MRIRDYGFLLVFVVVIGFLSLTVLWLPFGVEIVAFWEYPLFIILALIGFYVLNTLIEYGALNDILKTRGINKPDLLLIVILINLVTFPPTQLLFYFSFAFVNLILLYLYPVIEILVMIIEWLIYRLKFQNLIIENPKDGFLSSKIILTTSVIINLLSFLIIGFINSYLFNLYSIFG